MGSIQGKGYQQARYGSASSCTLRKERLSADHFCFESSRQLGWPSLSDRRLNNRLKILGKTVAIRVALDTADLVQPLRQTRYSDLDLSFTALAVRIDAYKYSFFPRTIRDWNSLDTLSRSKLIRQPPVDISCC